MNLNEKVIQQGSPTHDRKSIFSFTFAGQRAMEAPSRKSGISAKAKTTKTPEQRHATISGQVDGQKSTKPSSSEIEDDEEGHVFNSVRRRSTGSSSTVFGSPTISQKGSGGRAPNDRHNYVDRSRSSSTKNKAASSRTAANHLPPPKVPSPFLSPISQASPFGSSLLEGFKASPCDKPLFDGFQASPSGSRNTSPRGFSAFGPRKSDDIFLSSEDEGQNELSTYSIFGYREPVKGQRKCTFKIPRGKEYTLWLSDGFDIYDIVSDGTLYRKGRTLINPKGKRLTELEPDLPDKVRAREIRKGQNSQKFWLDFVHRRPEGHKEILRKRTREPVAEVDEESEDEESEAEEDKNHGIEDKEDEGSSGNNETSEDDNSNDETSDSDKDDKDNNTEASEDDNSNDDTSESGESTMNESEELSIDLKKIDIEKLRSEGLEIDLEKLGRNYRPGWLQ